MEKVVLETNALVESVHVNGPEQSNNRPLPEWCRGKCPQCGDDVVSNCYYVGGRGYLIVWECWSSLFMNPTCNYQHIL